jgi:hypothetical protein
VRLQVEMMAVSTPAWLVPLASDWRKPCSVGAI